MANSNTAKRAAEVPEIKPNMPDTAATSANILSVFSRYLFMKDFSQNGYNNFLPPHYTGGLNNKKMVKGTPNSQ